MEECSRWTAQSSCPGIAVRRTASLRSPMSRASTSSRQGIKQDVDGRDKPGHDDECFRVGERCARPPGKSHRLDLDLAEFHYALAVLQGDAALGVLAVGCADDRLDAVERHVEARALGADLEQAPLAA